MSTHSIEDQIREQIEQFVDELTDLVRAAAMDAVGAALGNGSPAPARRGRPPGRKSKKKVSRKKRGRRSSRAPVDTAPVLAAIKASPGIGVTEIAAGLNTDSNSVKPAVAELLESKQIRKTGQRRGTKYHLAGGGVGAKKKAKRKAGKKKAGRREKSARRKTAAKESA